MAGPQLITYPDSLGGDLRSLDELLRTDLRGVFPGGVHLLPPYPSSGDRGFAPITYQRIEPRFGDWSDIEAVAGNGGLTLDLMINHISRRSDPFQSFQRLGRAAPEADLFLTLEKVWPDRDPTPEEVARIFLRKPEHPFSDITIEATGEVERIWTTFGPRVDWSEQIDLDVSSPATWTLFGTWFETLARHGVTTVRLDAVGYVIKKAGTSCFMVAPEIWEFLDRVSELAANHGLDVLPEIHDTHPTFEEITSRGFTTYNFTLPGLILHALFTGHSEPLRTVLRSSPGNQVTMLDCHDGIPVQPDLTGVLPVEDLRTIVETCTARGANISPLLGVASGLDAHQLNITYPSACGSDDAYLTARAIQLFTPGTPQVYYVGLLAGQNDPDAMAEQGEGRAINRHNYTLDEARAALAAPVVQQQLDLLRLRGTHPAFDGEFSMPDGPDGTLTMRWEHGTDTLELQVDLKTGTHRIR